MENYSIREARFEDLVVIKALVKNSHLFPFNLRYSRFLVAENEIGIIGFGQIRKHNGFGELNSLVVQTELRGQGIGSNLVWHLLQQVSEDIYLLCSDELKTFYNRFNFQTINYHNVPWLSSMKFFITWIPFNSPPF